MDDIYISLIAKYLSGDIEAEERERLFEWVNGAVEHKTYFEEMQRLWEISFEKSDDRPVDTDLAWQKVAQRINPATEAIERKPAKMFRFGQLLKIAAVFLGVVVAMWLYKGLDTTSGHQVAFQTPANEKKQIELPDGSKVWLNENSKLTYEEGFHPRLIHLEGEAFFEVMHTKDDARFEIESGGTKTTVLGTSFNVRAYPQEGQVEVTVTTGKVVFEHEKEKSTQAKQQVTLTAGESGIYEKDETNVLKSEKNISNADAWKTEKLRFEDARLADVKAVMERYFDIKISVENPKILNCPFSGLYQNPDVNQMVEVLKYSLELEIIQNNDTLIFKGKGCE